MENFVSQALFNHKETIHRLEIYVLFEKSPPRIHESISRLSRKNIRELTIGNCGDNQLPLHSSIYSCEKLSYLNLCGCILDAPPLTFKEFMFLECLILHEVDMPPNGTSSLVSSCPLLQRLELTDDRGFEVLELRTRAPNLKYLELRGDYSEICLDTPLLGELSIEWRRDKMYEEEESSVCNYTNFLGGCPNLEKLTGSYYFVKFLSIGLEFCHQSLVFHHLKEVELDFVSEDMKEMMVVTRLIIGAPNLHKLKISFEKVYKLEDDASEAWVASFRDLGCAPNFRHKKLKFVQMRGFVGRFAEKEFIKFLLESSPILKKMRLCRCYLSAVEKQNFRAELLGCPCASPNVKLSFTTANF